MITVVNVRGYLCHPYCVIGIVRKSEIKISEISDKEAELEECVWCGAPLTQRHEQ